MSQAGKQIIIALVNPVEGREEEFRAWYWGEHIAEVLSVEGFVSAQPFETQDAAGAIVSHRYATLYEIEGSAVAARERLFGAGVGMSDTIDLSTMVFAPFEAVGSPLFAASR